MVNVRSGASAMTVRGVFLFFAVSAIVAGILILIEGVCTVGTGASQTGSVGAAEWAGRVWSVDLVMPIGLILLAVAMFCLAYVYNANLCYLAGALLITDAVISWIIHFAAPTSTLGIRATAIVGGSILLITMVVMGIALRAISPALKVPALATGGYVLILLFGILGGIGSLLLVSWPNTSIFRAGTVLGGVGWILGGIAGILLFVAFLSAFLRYR